MSGPDCGPDCGCGWAPESPAAQEVIGLAAEALDAAGADDLRQAFKITVEVVRRHGPEGHLVLMCALADTVADRQGLAGGMIKAQAIDAHTGATLDVDTVPWWLRWCLRWIAARAGRDVRQQQALLATVPPSEWDTVTLALLHVAGTTLTKLDAAR